jgi:hypothetical protein
MLFASSSGVTGVKLPDLRGWAPFSGCYRNVAAGFFLSILPGRDGDHGPRQKVLKRPETYELWERSPMNLVSATNL